MQNVKKWITVVLALALILALALSTTAFAAVDNAGVSDGIPTIGTPRRCAGRRRSASWTATRTAASGPMIR